MEKYLWIIIVVLIFLIALYIVYLVVSNRRFHRMVDPQLERLRRYEEARKKVFQQGKDPDAETPRPVYEEPKEEPDYTAWKEEKK